MSTYLRLLAYLKPYWWALLLVVLGFAINAATEVSVARLMQFIIDAINEKNREHLNWFPALIIGLFVLRGTGTFLGNYFSALVARNVVYKLRLQVFDKMLSLPQSYYIQNSGGALSAKLIYDVEQVTAAGTDALKTMLRDGMIVIGLLSYLIYSNWRLSLTLLVVLPAVGLVVRYASKRFRKLSHRVQNSMGEVSHVVNEAITGFDVVRNYGGKEQEFARFEKASRYNLKQSIKMVVTSSINTPVVQLLMAIGMSAVVWLALRPDIISGTTSGEFIAYITAAGLLSKPVRSLTQVNEHIQRGIAAADSIFALIDTTAEQDTGKLSPTLRGDIQFANAALTYNSDTDEPVHALADFNLQVKTGQTVAFVGRSGAGKTSLISLLTRTNELSGGQILLDGTPIADMTLASLRSQIASVSQHVILFDTTIYDNIAYGELAAKSEAEVIAAAKAAFAHDFIMALPEGYQTQVGSAGQSLSGGQRQRVAIARALLKDAPILILDEATSALDNESEHHIQQALENAMTGRTTLVIAHRLSTIESADVIVVMDAGRIVEQGTHAELLALNGLYASMHARDFADNS